MRRSFLAGVFRSALAGALVIAAGCWPAGAAEQAKSAAEPAIDDTTGLVMAADWELARAHCGVCHSYRLVTANRGDRTYWLDTLRWMQRTQNLWPIPPQQEGKLLDYLAANYSESEWGRRPPLSPALLPGN